MSKEHLTRGWGIVEKGGAEIWDAEPIFFGSKIGLKDRVSLLFYPKKWFLYRYVEKSVKGEGARKSILDVGCGTGGAVIDLKKLVQEKAEVHGVDVVQMQVDLAREKIQKHRVKASVQWFDGIRLPFPDKSFVAVYSSDVLGHVANVPAWLKEVYRVMQPGATLALFSESQLGRHAFIRQYLYKRGLNLDPHAAFHISLYSKSELRALLEQAGFTVEKMYGSFWAKFFVHPDELATALQSQSRFPLLKKINAVLFTLKKKTHPFSTALAELYGLLEMLLIGKWLETQGYIILAKKD